MSDFLELFMRWADETDQEAKEALWSEMNESGVVVFMSELNEKSESRD